MPRSLSIQWDLWVVQNQTLLLFHGANWLPFLGRGLYQRMKSVHSGSVAKGQKVECSLRQLPKMLIFLCYFPGCLEARNVIFKFEVNGDKSDMNDDIQTVVYSKTASENLIPFLGDGTHLK